MTSITEPIGRVLGARYRLVTPLGAGASAQVFLADDLSLDRSVAIKLLHPGLAGDASFFKRFRAEARVVAALNHPNVLQVYDWGEEDGTPFLVLEYLAGGSLGQVYDTGARLTPEQAVRVGVEACAGLVYAHRRGLVHRDIKPANILFDGDERLRIADFGLARALAGAAWTEPQGTVLGTARYAAPEQAEGRTLDGKADVYALAVVLYEGVTGQVPFSGDTALATLMARVGAALPSHDALGPLNGLLSQATAPDPGERDDSAAFGARLRALAAALPEPEPLAIRATGAPVEAADRSGSPRPDRGEGSEGLTVPFGFVVGAAPGSVADRTVLGDGWTDSRTRTELGTGTELGVSTPAAGARTELGTPAVAAAGSERIPTTSSPPTVGDGGPPATVRHPAAPVRRSGKRRWPTVALIAAVAVVVLGVGGYVAAKTKLFTPSHPVPSLVGRSLPAATRLVDPDHFTLRRTGLVYSITVGPGLIVSQTPVPRRGTRVVTAKQGSTIAVVVSKGLPPVAIPSVASFANCHDAIQALQAIHLVGVCPASAAQYSSTVGAGGILGSTPASTAPYGSTVTIVTSKGHAPVAVPSVAGPGSSYGAAAAALKAAGLVPVEAHQYSATVLSTQVIGTSPGPSSGPVPFGSTVTVDVSKGPQPVTIPDVLYSGVASAIGELEALGLKVTTYGPSGSGIVVFCDPSAGTQVLPGATVVLDTI